MIIERITTSGAKKAAAPKKVATVKEENPKVKITAKKKVPSKKETTAKKVASKKIAVKPDLSSKTVAALKAIAKDKNIPGYSSMKKADLIQALS